MFSSLYSSLRSSLYTSSYLSSLYPSLLSFAKDQLAFLSLYMFLFTIIESSIYDFIIRVFIPWYVPLIYLLYLFHTNVTVNSNIFIKDAYRTTLFNFSFQLLLMYLLNKFDVLYSNTIPYPFYIRYPLFGILYESGFYLTHRLFHTRYLYSKFHIQHHVWIHPSLFSTFDSSLIEHIVINYLPVYVCSFLTSMNYIDNTILWTIGIVNAVYAHSTESVHFVHHKNKSFNYGSGSYTFDKLFGTFKWIG